VFGAVLVPEQILLLFVYERVHLPVIIVATSLLSATAVFYVSEYRELAVAMPVRKALACGRSP
jgi:hypothetical protein